jgi:DNA-binding response OmpR family regulator
MGSGSTFYTISVSTVIGAVVAPAVTRLRHKLEAEPTRPKLLVTEPGVGYRLQAE